MGRPRWINPCLPPALVAALVLALAVARASAAPVVMGAAQVKPYGEAVELARQAARAVLARSGRESCLSGKLTRALLGLSASCEAGGLRTPLCGIADQAVVVPSWTLPFMDSTAQQLLAALPAP
jgi:hypothetical protein